MWRDLEYLRGLVEEEKLNFSLSLALSSVRSLRRCQTRAACVVEQQGLLGMNVVSATFDPESC